jgi:hypothetical protein
MVHVKRESLNTSIVSGDGAIEEVRTLAEHF